VQLREVERVGASESSDKVDDGSIEKEKEVWVRRKPRMG
jgi:hypothetical protein